MAPAIVAGDWLLVDPTITRWPRRGAVVVFDEPDGSGLSVKRVAAGPRDRVAFADGYLELAEDEAWLLARRIGCDGRRSRLRAADRLAVIRTGPRRPPRRSGLVPLRPSSADRSHPAARPTLAQQDPGCPAVLGE